VKIKPQAKKDSIELNLTTFVVQKSNLELICLY